MSNNNFHTGGQLETVYVSFAAAENPTGANVQHLDSLIEAFKGNLNQMQWGFINANISKIHKTLGVKRNKVH